MAWDDAGEDEHDDDMWDEDEEEDEEEFDDEGEAVLHSQEFFDPIFDLPLLKDPLPEKGRLPSSVEKYKLKKTLPIIFDVVNLDVSGKENGTKKVR